MMLLHNLLSPSSYSVATPFTSDSACDWVRFCNVIAMKSIKDWYEVHKTTVHGCSGQKLLIVLLFKCVVVLDVIMKCNITS